MRSLLRLVVAIGCGLIAVVSLGTWYEQQTWVETEGVVDSVAERTVNHRRSTSTVYDVVATYHVDGVAHQASGTSPTAVVVGGPVTVAYDPSAPAEAVVGGRTALPWGLSFGVAALWNLLVAVRGRRRHDDSGSLWATRPERRMGWGAQVVSAGVVLVGVVVGFVIVGAGWVAWAEQATWTPVDAVVESSQQTAGTASYEVVARYQVGDETHTFTGGGFAWEVPPGGSLTLRYDPTQPSKALLPWEWDTTHVGVALGLLSLALLAMLARQAGRLRALFASRPPVDPYDPILPDVPDHEPRTASPSAPGWQTGAETRHVGPEARPEPRPGAVPPRDVLPPATGPGRRPQAWQPGAAGGQHGEDAWDATPYGAQIPQASRPPVPPPPAPVPGPRLSGSYAARPAVPAAYGSGPGGSGPSGSALPAPGRAAAGAWSAPQGRGTGPQPVPGAAVPGAAVPASYAPASYGSAAPPPVGPGAAVPAAPASWRSGSSQAYGYGPARPGPAPVPAGR